MALRCKAYAMPTTPYATITQHIVFMHAALGSPALSTLIKALKAGFLTSFPELTPALLCKYPHASISMIKGHLDQTRKNQGSTCTQPPIPPPLPTIELAARMLTIINGPADPHPIPHPIPSPIRHGSRTYNLYAACYPGNGQIFTDQTGRFPVRSTVGNSDMLILYDYDSNIIHVEAMR